MYEILIIILLYTLYWYYLNLNIIFGTMRL